MTPRMRSQAMTLLALTLPLMACAQAPAPAAPAAPAPAAAPRAPAPQLVSGLPDFTNLVEQVGPGVVNVETTIVRSNRQARGMGPGGDDEMPEFFRRFFGPDFQMPGQGPRWPGRQPAHPGPWHGLGLHHLRRRLRADQPPRGRRRQTKSRSSWPTAASSRPR